MIVLHFFYITVNSSYNHPEAWKKSISENCSNISEWKSNPVLFCYQFLVIQVTILISLLGISFEAKQLGTHVYSDWNKTTVKNKCFISLVLFAGLIPTYLLKKSVISFRAALGISEVFE